jgi:hypothetical protein
MFILYINDLSNIIINKSKPVLFADDTRIITNCSPKDYENYIIKIFKNINYWCKANLLTLKLDKTYSIQFFIMNSNAMNVHTDYGNNHIAKSTNTKFLGLIMDNMLSWKEHVDWLMSKLGSACYAIRAVKPCMLWERMIYFSYFHSVMAYHKIFWDNSPHSIHIFRLQKRVITITVLLILEVQTLAGNCLRN